MTSLRARLAAGFARSFGEAPTLFARAPGRVNLIGEHTDYNDGFVLPAAISVETMIAARPTDERSITIAAVDYAGASSHIPLDAPFAKDPGHPWADYVRGMISAMQAAGHRLTGAQLAVAGSIPRGSGLSSSASLTVAVGTALVALAGLRIDPVIMARLAQTAESDFVGIKCGIMDQLASACGRADHALLIDCRSLACQPVAVPVDMAILIVHSGVVRGLVEGHYNQRRAQCEAAARKLGVAALRDADSGLLEAAGDRLTALEYARTRHVITENARTLAAAQALRQGDLAGLGQLMAASHASMRDDFAITTPEIDRLVAELQALIGPEGGARMTGGGFGGAVVAVLHARRAGEVSQRLTYRTPAGDTALVMIERACPGASLA